MVLNSHRRSVGAGVFRAGVVLGLLLGLSTLEDAVADTLDCSAPTAVDDVVVTSQCLFILNAAVDNVVCPGSGCACDPNGDGMITAADALICLNAALGLPVELACPEPCAQPPVQCTGFDLIVAPGAELDVGWKGPGHGAELLAGSKISVDVLKRCAHDDSVCSSDQDCGGAACEPTCDCNSDEDCEVIGPVGPQACINDSSIPCSTNADCTRGGNRCVTFFGPPLPIAASGVPSCLENYFSAPVIGTVNPGSGEFGVEVPLRTRPLLGINIETPCPVCGDDSAVVGEAAVCAGGPNNGNACVVEGVSSQFGPISGDCPPDRPFSNTIPALNLRLSPLSTRTAVHTATLQCGFPFDGLHPSTGNAACLNDFSPCATNEDCDGATCGLYCHCGFCDEGMGAGPDPDLPCRTDADCDAGVCSSDPQSFIQSTAQPNGCESLVCGEANPEECCTSEDEGCESPTGLDGSCDGNPNPCSNNNDCVTFGNGDECILTPRPCFEHTVNRSGQPSPLGRYCADDADGAVCVTNEDCTEGACVSNIAHPVAAAITCMGSTASAAINSAAGLAGPIALRVPLLVVPR